MSPWVISLVVRPLVVFAILVLVLCVQLVVWKLMPDSKLKRALFKVRGRR